MTPSLLRSRRAFAAAATLPLLLLGASACGDDASDAADAVSEAIDSAADSTSEAASGAVEATDEEIDAALEDLDAMSDESVLDAVGTSVVSVLGDATGYEVDGDVLYVDVDGDAAMAVSNCQIVLGAASALADDPQVVLRYSDEEVDCSELL